MPKFRGEIKVGFDVTVEADDNVAADEIIRNMDISDVMREGSVQWVDGDANELPRQVGR